MNQLITPYGGTLIDRLVDPQRAEILKTEALSLASIDLDRAQLCDLELLLNGAYSPLQGYLGQENYKRVLAEQRLNDGTFWPWPVHGVAGLLPNKEVDYFSRARSYEFALQHFPAATTQR